MHTINYRISLSYLYHYHVLYLQFVKMKIFSLHSLFGFDLVNRFIALL